MVTEGDLEDLQWIQQAQPPLPSARKYTAEFLGTLWFLLLANPSVLLYDVSHHSAN